MALRKLHVESLAETEPQPMRWIVPDIVAQGRVTLLYGEGGLGKSLLAMSMASAITDGLPYLGRMTHPRKVLIVDSENGEHLLHLRIHALGLRRNVEAYDATGFDLITNGTELAHVVGVEQPGVLVLDSLRSLAPSMDENDSASVTMALKGVTDIAREYDVGVLILHHKTKGGGFRGSGALRDQVDVMLEMGRYDNDKKLDRRFVRWEKNRLGAEPKPAWLRIIPDGWDDKITVMESSAPYEETA